MQIASKVSMWSGARTRTAKDYVQDGLIAMWDGIENAGWGTHDASATAWKDLVGNCDGTSHNVSFGDDCAIFNGTSSRFDLASQTPFSSTNLQIEAVIQLATPYQASTVVNAGGNMPCFTISTSAQKIVTYAQPTGNPLYPLWPLDITKASSLSVAYQNKTSNAAYQDAVAKIQNGVGGVNDESSVAKIGARRAGGNYGQYFKGRIYCLRVYSRALTAEEIARNYAIDKARFNLP